MSRKYFFIILCIAVICLALILIFMLKEPTPIPQKPIYTPSPFKSYISGIGIVEPSSGNIFIETPLNRIVKNVQVIVGMKVKKGDILFELDDRDLQADLLARRIEYENAKTNLQKLESLPRSEDLAFSEATLKSAQIQLSQAKSEFEMVQGLQDTRAVSQEEIQRRRFNFEQAEAKWEEANANLKKIKAGTWKPDLETAYLQTLQAKANIDRVNAEIQQTIIRAPIDGTILQIKIHVGEYPLDGNRTPAMIIGNIDELHLRVSIDQYDAPHFNPQAPAIAYLQGDMRVEFPLEFVTIEPYLVYKQNLNNEITERVDTRVLQIIYRFKPNLRSRNIASELSPFSKVHMLALVYFKNWAKMNAILLNSANPLDTIDDEESSLLPFTKSFSTKEAFKQTKGAIVFFAQFLNQIVIKMPHEKIKNVEKIQDKKPLKIPSFLPKTPVNQRIYVGQQMNVYIKSHPMRENP